MTDDPVADLLTRVAAQDRAAFATLYAQTSAKLMGVFLRMLQDRAESEDALQEIYTRVWLRAGRFDAARGRGMTWLIALARHLAIDRLRARPAPADDPARADRGAYLVADQGADQVADPAPSAESRVIAKGDAGRIADCFDRLEPAKAEAVRGAYLSGLSYAELASRHAVPLNTMRTWLRRSLMSLKDCLDA